jgi:acyl-CoA thioester hydrolase
MSAADLAIEIEVVPAFYDIDPMLVVWHGHYLKFFERARGALFDRLGYGYAQMHASGYAFPIVDLRVKYVRPARLGQTLRVAARITEWENRVRTDYRIRDAASGTTLTRGHSLQVAVALDSGEMQFVCPPVLFERLGVPAP